VVASVTKVPGSLVMIPLAILYYQKYRLSIRKELAPVLLVPSGMVAYLLYLYLHGTLDFRPAQQHFSQLGVGLFIVPIWQYIRHPFIFHTWHLMPLNFAVMVLAFAAGFLLIRRGQPALGAYALAAVLLPLTATQTMASMTRYMLSCCSLYIALAILGRSRKLYETLYVVCILLFVGLTLLFALHFGIAQA